MNNNNRQFRFEIYRMRTYYTAALAVLAGVIILLIGFLLSYIPLISYSFTAVGVGLIVCVATIFLQRHLAFVIQYELISSAEERILSLIESRFDILKSCSEVGIRFIYPEWPTFCENELPERLRTFERSFVAIGIALSELSRLFFRGSLRAIMDECLKSGKEFTFCMIRPDSEAVRYRTDEVDVKFTPGYTVEASLDYLVHIKSENPGCNLHIKTLEKIVPKFAIVCIDDEVILVSPYYSSTLTPVSYVIETHKGDDLFQQLEKDIKCLLARAKDWPGRAGPKEIDLSGIPSFSETDEKASKHHDTYFGSG